MYRYALGDSQETIQGIQGLLLDEFKTRLELPPGNMAPHVTILGFRELHNKLNNYNSNVCLHAARSVYDGFMDNINGNLPIHAFISGIGSTGKLVKLYCSDEKRILYEERSKAHNYLNSFAQVSHLPAPHISLVKALSSDRSLIQETKIATNEYIQKYIDPATIILSGISKRPRKTKLKI